MEVRTYVQWTLFTLQAKLNVWFIDSLFVDKIIIQIFYLTVSNGLYFIQMIETFINKQNVRHFDRNNHLLYVHEYLKLSNWLTNKSIKILWKEYESAFVCSNEQSTINFRKKTLFLRRTHLLNLIELGEIKVLKK